METTPKIINDLRANARFYRGHLDASLIRSLDLAAQRLEELSAENLRLRDDIDKKASDSREEFMKWALSRAHGGGNY